MKWLIALALVMPALAQNCSTPIFPNAVANQSQLLVAVDNIQTTLVTTQVFSDTIMTVINPAGIIPNMLLTIGFEQEKVTGVSANVITVVRGYANTTPINHPAKSIVANLIDACYNNVKTSEINAIENTLGPNLKNVLGSLPFVLTAVTPTGQVITSGTHNQGQNAGAECHAGPVVSTAGVLVASGPWVGCYWTNDGLGNITVQWYPGTVGSIKIFAAGRGPIGFQGPSGLGASPYVVNATSSGQSIPVGTHQQGANISISCWSGPLVTVGGVPGISGIPATCLPTLDGAGNITSITWSGTVGSIIVSASGTPAPYTQNSGPSPMTILQTAHKKGVSPDVSCFDGALNGNAITGTRVICQIDINFSGDVVVKYAGLAVGSVRIQ